LALLRLRLLEEFPEQDHWNSGGYGLSQVLSVLRRDLQDPSVGRERQAVIAKLVGAACIDIQTGRDEETRTAFGVESTLAGPANLSTLTEEVLVDTWGEHSRYIGKSVADTGVLDIVRQSQGADYLGTPIAGGRVGLVMGNPNLRAPGSTSRDLIQFIETHDLQALKGGAPEVHWSFVLTPVVQQRYTLGTVTATTVDNRNSRGLQLSGPLDSAPLGSVVQDNDAAFQMLEGVITQDHHRGFSETRTGEKIKSRSFDATDIAKRYLEESVYHYASAAYTGREIQGLAADLVGYLARHWRRACHASGSGNSHSRGTLC
jgi:hypothetical protein